MISVESDNIKMVETYSEYLRALISSRDDCYFLTSEELQEYLGFEEGAGADDHNKMTAIALVFEIQRDKAIESAKWLERRCLEVNKESGRQYKQLQGWQHEAGLLAQQVRDLQIELSRRPLK